MAERRGGGDRSALLRWYQRVARALPWRATRDPYAIWVSEVMLQQTRVDTVIPYYQRFLERFPDVAALAAADEDDVLSAWSGLGYYRRARLLQRGVREVIERYGGEVPRSPDARRSLPGVGRYTAGAIGSIAFGLQEPVVDGNVARVLSRLRGVEATLGTAQSESALWAEAERLVRGPDPGALNQALMELGATVCTPTSPKCEVCPLARSCVARATERQAELPRPRIKRAPLEVALVAVISETREGVWIVRSEGALFGGLWGVPTGPGADAKAARALLRELGVRGGRLAHRGEVAHVLTHRRLSVNVFTLATERGARVAGERVHPTELSKRGVSTLTRKILALGSGPQV